MQGSGTFTLEAPPKKEKEQQKKVEQKRPKSLEFKGLDESNEVKKSKDALMDVSRDVAKVDVALKMSEAGSVEHQTAENSRKESHHTARNIFLGVASTVKSYDQKKILLKQYWDKTPLKDVVVVEQGGQSWDYGRFEKRLDAWDKSSGNIDGFFGEKQFSRDKLGGKGELEISFVSPEEAPSVQNDKKMILSFFENEIEGQGGSSEETLEAVNVLNLIRRSKVGRDAGKIAERRRVPDPALHNEQILSSEVKVEEGGGANRETNVLDGLIHFVSTMDSGEFKGTQGEDLRDVYKGRIKDEILTEIVKLSKMEKGVGQKEETEFEKGLLDLIQKTEGLKREVASTLKGKGMDVSIFNRPTVDFSWHEGTLKGDSQYSVVEMIPPTTSEGLVQEPVHEFPPQKPVSEPEPEPVQEEAPKMEAVESKPMDIDKSYKQWEVNWEPKSDRTVERYEGSLNDIQKVINNELLQLLPEGVDPARFLVVASEVARNYTPDRGKPVKNSNGLPFINLLNQAEYGTKEGKFLRVNLVSLVMEVYNRVDVTELPTREGLADSEGVKAADTMNKLYESSELRGDDERDKITTYQEKKHELTEKYYDKLIAGEQKKLDDLLEGPEAPGTAEEKERLDGEISRLKDLKEKRLDEYKSDKGNAVLFKIIGERISDLAANSKTAENLSRKIPDDFKPVAKRNNAMKGKAETWMKSLGYSK